MRQLRYRGILIFAKNRQPAPIQQYQPSSLLRCVVYCLVRIFPGQACKYRPAWRARASVYNVSQLKKITKIPSRSTNPIIPRGIFAIYFCA